jgi:hypothetical protein
MTGLSSPPSTIPALITRIRRPHLVKALREASWATWDTLYLMVQAIQLPTRLVRDMQDTMPDMGMQIRIITISIQNTMEVIIIMHTPSIGVCTASRSILRFLGRCPRA